MADNFLLGTLVLALVVMGGMSFFYNPVYEKAVWFIIGALVTAFTTVIGYKFGRSMPEQSSDPRPGQSSETTSTKIG